MAQDWLFLAVICHLLRWEATFGFQECLKSTPFCVTSVQSPRTFLCQAKGTFPSSCGQFYLCPGADHWPCECRCRNINKYFDPQLRKCILKLDNVKYNCSTEALPLYRHTNSTQGGLESCQREGSAKYNVHLSQKHKRKGRTKINGFRKRQKINNGEESLSSSISVATHRTGPQPVTVLPVTGIPTGNVNLEPAEVTEEPSGDLSQGGVETAEKGVAQSPSKTVKDDQNFENDVVRERRPPVDSATFSGANAPTQGKLQGRLSESAEVHLIMDGLGDHIPEENDWSPALILEDPSLFPAWLIAFIVVVVVIAMMLLVLVMYD